MFELLLYISPVHAVCVANMTPYRNIHKNRESAHSHMRLNLMCFERYLSLNILVTKTLHRRRVELSFFHLIYEMVSVDIVLPRDAIEEMIHCRFQF